MIQREKVVEHVSEMIGEFGIKAVRMDDVAYSLGVSKRTLYEIFGDKEDLIFESLCRMMDAKLYGLSKMTSSYDNMLDVLLMSVRELCNERVMRRNAQRLALDVKKYYPAIYKRLQHRHSEKGLLGLRYALDRCRAEGYLDSKADIELMAQLFLMNVVVLMSEDRVVLPDGVSRERAFGVLIVNFLRGMASVDGLRKIDEILARERGLINE